MTALEFVVRVARWPGSQTRQNVRAGEWGKVMTDLNSALQRGYFYYRLKQFWWLWLVIAALLYFKSK
jgi:hypothetical protein